MEKKLYKSKNERMLAGVCGGIAEYFSVDPVLIRLAVVVFVLLGGSGILFYIIAAIIMKDNPYQGYNGREPDYSYEASPENTPDEDGTSPGTEKKGTNKGRNTGIIIIGGFLVVIGASYLINIYMPWFNTGVIAAGLAIVIGLVLMVKKI